MDFSFNEEQRSLAETVASVLADFPALMGPELTMKDHSDAWGALAELGFFSLVVPEDHGGVGLTMVDCALAIEALGAGLAPPLVSSTLIATEVIGRHGTTEQKLTLLGPIAQGEKKIAIAISERGQGSPLRTRCRVTDGRLAGRKIAVPGALDADAFLVTAQTDRGPVLALIDSAAAGVSRASHESLDPTAGLGVVEFLDVEIGHGQLLDAIAVESMIDIASTVEAGLAIGVAGLMLDRAVEYAKTRQQFGQPIGAFQTIKHRCADMAVAVEAGRATAYYAFWACGMRAADQAQRASSAKAYCSEIARDACNESIQIHGGMGFTWELGLHRFLRRTRVLLNSLGGAAWHYRRVFEESLRVVPDGQARRDAA